MKIYIPMKENYEHWHLIVINNEEQKIYQLDSHWTSEAIDKWKATIASVVQIIYFLYF